jgi:hypothetical protein
VATFIATKLVLERLSDKGNARQAGNGLPPNERFATVWNGAGGSVIFDPRPWCRLRGLAREHDCPHGL